jgi:hypothetical protein
MIHELTIENFRAFRALHLVGLGRVNLIVGANNSGKTSVLEAVAFLASGGDPLQLHASLSRRGEQALADEVLHDQRGVDVRYLFFGRTIGDDATSRLRAFLSNGKTIDLRLSTPRVPDEALARWRDNVGQSTPRGRGRGEPVAIELDRQNRTPRYLTITSSEGWKLDAALLPNGGLAYDNAALTWGIEPILPVAFLSTKGVDDDTLADLYEKMVLTPEEATVVTALREVESGIARLATRQIDGKFGGGRGFIVSIEGAAQQLPLGSLGDGMHRILAITLSLVAARGGYLLVDEIDTGLHHTVMRKMWKLVFETAKRLDVTVFATTHSYDCVHALAGIANPDAREAGEVSLIRVERGNPEGVHFTEEEIAHLAEWQIEAR